MLKVIKKFLGVESALKGCHWGWKIDTVSTASNWIPIKTMRFGVNCQKLVLGSYIPGSHS